MPSPPVLPPVEARTRCKETLRLTQEDFSKSLEAYQTEAGASNGVSVPGILKRIRVGGGRCGEMTMMSEQMLGDLALFSLASCRCVSKGGHPCLWSFLDLVDGWYLNSFLESSDSSERSSSNKVSKFLSAFAK